MIKLHEVAKVNSKQIDKNFTYKDIRYIDIASVTKGNIYNIQNLKTTDAPSRAKRLVKKNDILYSTVRPNLEHYVFIKDEVSPNTVASTGFAVITPDEKIIDPYYLYCLLTQPRYTQFLSQVAEQAVSTYPTVSPNTIEDLEFNLPPLPEQKRISSILSSFDNKIEQLKKENNILEDIAQNIFKEWFVKYNFPNKDGKPYKDNNGKMIDSELGEIPEGWRVGKIYEICTIDYGYPFDSDLFSNSNGFPLIRIRNLSDSITDTYTSEEYNNKHIVDPGDLLVGMDGDFIVTQWFGPRSLLNQRVCRLTPINISNKLFIKNITKPYIKLLQKTNLGTTVAHLGKSDWDRFKIILPNDKTLQLYTNLFFPIEQKVLINHEELKELTALKTIQLKILMS